MAQSLTNAFGGLSESSKDPIDIESDILEVHDKDKYATFKGNVKAVQGTTTLRARELKVHYVGGGKLASVGNKDKGQEAAAPAKTAGAEGGAAEDDENAQITKIEAKGQVVITSEKDQTTTSDWALYDVPAQQVTVGGNVVLTQGKNVLKGDRLVIDLKTGESRFDNTGSTAAGGRIRALFMPKGAAKAAKPGDAKSSEDDASSEKPAAGAEDETPADDDSPTNLWPPRSETEP
jgi:lipopolysaccharide export system protein LptA